MHLHDAELLTCICTECCKPGNKLMSDQRDSGAIAREGSPAPFVRFFGWSMLALLAAFLINNILHVGFAVPTAMDAFNPAKSFSPIPWALYLLALAAGVFYIRRSPRRNLRWEADAIHRFNKYLVRGCFWAVLLVGVVDVAIAFMRVERLLIVFVDEDMVRNLARARFVGTYIHIPLIALGFVLAAFTRTLGFTWLALLIVLSELLIVITRFVFSYEQALMGDLVRYWYAALFLFASAYTLFDEGHVRVDVLYAGFRQSTRGFFNALGCTLLGMSTCWVILLIGLSDKQSIINAPIMNFEITQTGGTGMFVKYQMAAYLGIFAITMLIQFVSYFFESVADYRAEPGARKLASLAEQAA